MVKRFSDSLDSCAPLNRRWTTKDLWKVIALAITIIGTLIYMGVNSVLGSIEKKVDRNEIIYIKDQVDKIESKVDDLHRIFYEEGSKKRK